MFPPVTGRSEEEIKADIDRLLHQLESAYTSNDLVVVVESLTNYLAYKTQDKMIALQREASNQTKEIVKMNRRLVILTGFLAGGTVTLAIATFVLAYITWMKP